MSDLECTVCASGVPATPGQMAHPLQSAVSALQRLADKTPMGNWDEPEPAEVALRRDYAQAALDEITAQVPHAAPELAAAMRETRLMREGITALRADLEREAAIIHPSKVSQVKRDVSDRLAKILQGK